MDRMPTDVYNKLSLKERKKFLNDFYNPPQDKELVVQNKKDKFLGLNVTSNQPPANPVTELIHQNPNAMILPIVNEMPTSAYNPFTNPLSTIKPKIKPQYIVIAVIAVIAIFLIFNKKS